MGEANRRSAEKSGGENRGAIEARMKALELVEPRDGQRPEPRRDRRARAKRDVADAPQARPRHVGDRLGVEAEGGERQVVEEFGEGFLAQIFGRDFLRREARQR